MNLPTNKECFRIIKEMEMMDHIIDHSIMVSNVAVCLCRGVRHASPTLNEDLVRTAALLHDITKTRSFSSGEIHSETGGGLMREMGYPEIGNIVRQHVMLDRNCQDGPVSEPELVNYADKRVLHDRVVSLDQRLDYIIRKYGRKPEFKPLIKKMWDNTTALEIKIFKVLPFPLRPWRSRSVWWLKSAEIKVELIGFDHIFLDDAKQVFDGKGFSQESISPLTLCNIVFRPSRHTDKNRLFEC